jgi:hypothetical protein
LREAIGKIAGLFTAKIVLLRIDNCDPVMFRGPADCDWKFSRPPINAALIDKGYEFRGRPYGSTYNFHHDVTQPSN